MGVRELKNGWLTLFCSQKNFSSGQNDAVKVDKNDTVKNKKKGRSKAVREVLLTIAN